MSAKYFLFIFFAVALAQEDQAELDDLRTLRDEALAKLQETATIINKAPTEFSDMTIDRLDCLLWEHTVQTVATNKTITKAVFKGMLKNKQTTNFQCISNNSMVTLGKLDAVKSQITENVQRIREKGLSKVMSFNLVIPGLFEYVEDLYRHKLEEIKAAKNEKEMKTILKEFGVKMQLLKTNLDKYNEDVVVTTFKFFEEFVDYVFKTENNLKKIQSEGAQKILKCVG